MDDEGVVYSGLEYLSPLPLYLILFLSICYLVVILVLPEFFKCKILRFSKDIFNKDSRRPVEQSHKAPSDFKEVLKPTLPSREELESLELDVALIGGGTSSLIAASILSKSGYKVAVFEQHTKLGGCCHVFKKGRFQFDTGVHYVGNMGGGEDFCQILDQLTEGQIVWYPMDECFDRLQIGQTGEGKKPRTIEIYAGYTKWKQHLKSQFPGNDQVFDKFEYLMKNTFKAGFSVGCMKIAPEFLVKLLTKFFTFCGPFYWWKFYFSRSAVEGLQNLTDNKYILACLYYIYGTIGVVPSRSKLFLQLSVADHYVREGGFYPKHGPSIIPYYLTKTIAKNNGKCYVRTKVDSLILNFDKKLKCEGINVSISKNDIVPVRARYVISGAGLFNTFHKMIPPEVVSKVCPRINWIKTHMKPSVGSLSLFVGLSDSAENLGIGAFNTYMFDSINFDTLFNEWISETDPWNAVENLSFPFLYVSFPSAKDRSFDYNMEKPGSTCTVITFCPYSWFEMWNDKPVGKRGDQYLSLKDALRRKMWDQVLKTFPLLESKVEVMDIGTPVSSNFYLNAQNGEVYGMSHDVDRYSEDFVTNTRFKNSDISGLYLTGQDTWSCGFVPAIITGSLVCTTITGRNYMDDVKKLYPPQNNNKKTKGA